MSHIKTDDNLPQKLADEFSRLVRDALTYDQVSEVLRRNTYYLTGVCATHDFLDANIQMAEAFELVTGRESEPASDVDAALWRAAWALAKNAGFPRKLELIENAEGIPVFAYAIREMWIDSPHASVCTRFPADPAADYGLREEEVAALDYANSLLVAERVLRDQAAHVSETCADQVLTPAARPAGLLAVVRRFLGRRG